MKGTRSTYLQLSVEQQYHKNMGHRCDLCHKAVTYPIDCDVCRPIPTPPYHLFMGTTGTPMGGVRAGVRNIYLNRFFYQNTVHLMAIASTHPLSLPKEYP